MKGLISNQSGPKLDEILRLLAQSDTPTHVALRGFGHSGTGTVSVRDGRLLNASCGGDTGDAALSALLSQDSWHFETSSELQSTRADFAGDEDVGIHMMRLRAGMLATRAEAQAESRRSRTFSVVGDQVSGNLESAEKQRLEEDYAFFGYYARELGASLGLGVSKAIACSEVDRAMAVKLRGNQWEGVFSGRPVPLSQILAEVP